MECGSTRARERGMALTTVRRTSGSRATADSAPTDYLVRVQKIAPALAAAAEEIDRRRELPESIVEALIERGLFRLLLPHSLGGAELLPAQYIPIIEAIAQVDASTAWCINQNSVKDLFVPEAYSVDVLSRRDGTATREEGLLYRFSSLSLYAGGFAGVALGIARSTLSHFIELARDKIPRGARNTLRNNNVIQSEVARAEARLSSARGWLVQSFEGMIAAVVRRGQITLDEP